jgi:hypothetical protein
MLTGKIQNFGKHLMVQGYILKFMLLLHITSKFLIECLTHLLRTGGVLASNLSPEIDYLEGHHGFPVSKTNSEIVSQIRPRPLPSTPYLIPRLLIVVVFNAV